MSHGQMDGLVDGMERMEETSFLGLPDVILIQFFERMDIPSRLKLRVNKRLMRLYCCIKNTLDKIEVEIDKDEMSVEPSYLIAPLRSFQNGQLKSGFDIIVRSTYVHSIVVSIKELEGGNDWKYILEYNERIGRIIDSLSNFESDSLVVYSLPGGIISVNMRLSLSTVLVLGQNFKSVRINVLCNSLTAQDLVTIRKTIMEGGCKMESFQMLATEFTRNYFMGGCFGVSMNFRVLPPAYFECYRCEDESIELYTDQSLPRHNLTHFERGLQTSVQRHPSKKWYRITFKTGNIDAKPDSKNKIKLNQFYQWTQ